MLPAAASLLNLLTCDKWLNAFQALFFSNWNNFPHTGQGDCQKPPPPFTQCFECTFPLSEALLNLVMHTQWAKGFQNLIYKWILSGLVWLLLTYKQKHFLLISTLICQFGTFQCKLWSMYLHIGTFWVQSVAATGYYMFSDLIALFSFCFAKKGFKWEDISAAP